MGGGEQWVTRMVFHAALRQGPTFSDRLQRLGRPVVHAAWSRLTLRRASLLRGGRLGLRRCFIAMTLTLLRGTLRSNETAGPGGRQRVASLRLRAGVRGKASQLPRAFLACDLARPRPRRLTRRGRGVALRIRRGPSRVRSLPSRHDAAGHGCGACRVGDGAEGDGWAWRGSGVGGPRGRGRLHERVGGVCVSAGVVGRLVAVAALLLAAGRVVLVHGRLPVTLQQRGG